MMGSKAIVCGAAALSFALVVFAVVPIVENAVDRPEKSARATNRAEVASVCANAAGSLPARETAVVAAPRASGRLQKVKNGVLPSLIREIEFAGETNLVRLAEARSLVRELLCDGFPKGEEDIRTSLAYATIELAASGDGAGTLVYRGEPAFDRDACRLTVTVRRTHSSKPASRQPRRDRRHSVIASNGRASRGRGALARPSDTGTSPKPVPVADTSSVGRVVFEVRDRGGNLVCATAPAVTTPLAAQASAEPQSRLAKPIVQSVEAARTALKSEPPPEVPIVETVFAPTLADTARIGVIRAVNLKGPEDFIEDEDILELLAHPLCDGCVKTVGDLRRALAAARSELVQRGFLLVSLVPSSDRPYHKDTQTIDIDVRPGTYGDVEITMKSGGGNGKWHSSRQVGRYFKALKHGEVFNYNDFRNALGRLNANPDFVADATVAVSVPMAGDPDFSAGRTADLKLEVEDSLPLHGSLQFDNYAMEELGYWQAALLLQYLNLTGAGDTISVSPAMTLNGDMWSVAGSYRYPFEWLLGGSVSVAGGYSHLNADDVTERLDLVGAGAYAGLGLSFNLWDSDRRNLALNAGLQWRYLDDIWSIPSYYMPGRRLHILPLTLGISYSDKRRDWLGGLDFLNAGESANLNASGDFDSFVEDGQSHYWIFRGSWSRLQPLIGPGADGEEWRCWSLFTRLEGQYSEQTLLTAERVALGGHSALRGYRTRGYIGDNGIYGTAEFRTPVFCDPITSIFCVDDGSPAFERFQFHVFTDLGDVALNEELSGFEDNEFLWSAGLGMRMGLTRYLSMNFDVAFPLRKAYLDDEDRDMELYLSVRAQY